MLEGFKSLFSATAVEKILNEDAIILGRLNLMNLRWEVRMKIVSTDQ